MDDPVNSPSANPAPVSLAPVSPAPAGPVPPTQPAVMPAPSPVPAPAIHRAPPLTPANLLPWVLLALALVAVGLLAWKLFKPADLGDPIATGLVSFEKQDKLTVFSAQLAPVVASDDARLFGLIKSRQVAVIPARVDYGIDLASVGRERMRWNPDTHTLSVRLPDVSVSRPNLDEAHAQYLREGMWITRDAQDKLTRDNTLLAEQQADGQAHQPVLIDLARAAAREAVQQNLSIPLKVAGYGDVKVLVTIDGEPNPG